MGDYSIFPTYTVYQYNLGVYRIVKHKVFPPLNRTTPPRSPELTPAERFSQSYSRSRSVVLQCALSNEWQFFVTITVDPKLLPSRYDLDIIWGRLYRVFREYRKKSPNFKYLLVPERHKDGAWHFHGFFSGVRICHVSNFVKGFHPRRLVDGGFFNFPFIADSIGFVSMSPINSAVAASFYVCKYISKDFEDADFYTHLYYRSKGLRTASLVAQSFRSSLPIDRDLTFECQYCSSGWLFGHPLKLRAFIDSIFDVVDEIPLEVRADYDFIEEYDSDYCLTDEHLPWYQESIAGWCSGNT